MSPLRERMIEDMTLAGLALGHDRRTPRRCAGWRCIADAHPISSAKSKYAATCSSCANRARRAGRSRSDCTASASSTSTHSVVVGICSGKKRVVVPGQKRLPYALSDDQVRQLLGHVRNAIPRTCLATMYACGLRIGEATTLEIRSIDRANQVLRIIGKGDKERLVLLPQPVLDELGTLWRTHRNPRWLFPNRCGDGPLNQRVLSHTFAAAADRAGIRSGVTSHALRHSYATRLIENGVDIRLVQILLGHTRIATTTIYTHLTTPTRTSLHTLLDRLMTDL